MCFIDVCVLKCLIDTAKVDGTKGFLYRIWELSHFKLENDNLEVLCTKWNSFMRKLHGGPLKGDERRDFFRK